MLAQGINSPVCSSAGRLFDGFGALLGLGRRNSFEGQLPLGVEIAAMQAPVNGGELPFRVHAATSGADWEIDWQPAVETVLTARRQDAAALAGAFHRGLVRALVEVACHAGVKTVALSGGCFQNALLRSLAETELVKTGFQVLAPRTLPPNDGAIAAGQALGALWHLTDVEMP
jgi:hydrogenase maturation protein HypF